MHIQHWQSAMTVAAQRDDVSEKPTTIDICLPDSEQSSKTVHMFRFCPVFL